MFFSGFVLLNVGYGIRQSLAENNLLIVQSNPPRFPVVIVYLDYMKICVYLVFTCVDFTLPRNFILGQRL